jgi:hypothetical protein
MARTRYAAPLPPCGVEPFKPGWARPVNGEDVFGLRRLNRAIMREAGK